MKVSVDRKFGTLLELKIYPSGIILPMQPKGEYFTQAGKSSTELSKSMSLFLYFLAIAYRCRATAVVTPKFIASKKWAGIPIAAKITVAVLPAVVRGTGAPNP